MTFVVVSEDGTVTVTDAALDQIVVQAAEAVTGVRVRRRRRRHVDVQIDTGGAHVALDLDVAYGVVLPDAARAVQERVADALGTMCGVNVRSVDVAVEELR
jgi:uncharacterized alkaline shock family protein YloU